MSHLRCVGLAYSSENLRLSLECTIVSRKKSVLTHLKKVITQRYRDTKKKYCLFLLLVFFVLSVSLCEVIIFSSAVGVSGSFEKD